MSSVKELKSDTNVILKLDLGEKGGIRRIRLSKLWNNDYGGVSYQKLKDVIMELNSTTTPPTTTTTSRKEVVVTYKDEDDDIITISTNEELSDAFLQFVDKVPPILRATATTTTTTYSTGNQSTSNHDPPPQPQVVKLVDAIHDAVDTACPPRCNSETQSTSNNTNNSPPPHEQADTMAKKVASNLKPENFTTQPSTTKHSNDDNSNNNNHNEKKEKEEEPVTSKNESKSVVEEVDWSKFNKSFIHGRHTCDGCLITPIVGIRYRAKNIADYDLCEKCITKASNQNVNFEPAQLEWDVPFQARWLRRQQRLEFQQKQRMNFLDPQRNQPPLNQEEEDIKEAIRLSLLSCNVPNQGTTKQDATKDSNQDTCEKEPQAVVPSLKPTDEDDDTNNTTKDSPSFKNETKQASDTHQATTTETPTTNDTDKTHKKEEEEEMVKTTISVIEQATMISPLNQTNDDKATKEVETSTSKSCDETNYNDSSFEMDAEGSGDIAVAIGQTLDKCAKQINSIVVEIGKSSSSSDAMTSSFTSFDSALQTHNDIN